MATDGQDENGLPLDKIGPLFLNMLRYVSSFLSCLAKIIIDCLCFVLFSIIYFSSSSWTPKTILFTRKIIYTDTCFLFQKRHKADDQVNNRRVKGKIAIQLIFRCTFVSLNFACA